MSTHTPFNNSASPAHPYLDWAIATNFAYLRPGEWIPLLVETESGPENSRGRFISLEWLETASRDDIRIPHLFRQPLSEELESLHPVTIYVMLIRREGAGALVADGGWQQTIRRAEMGPPMPDAAAGEGPFNEPPTIDTPDAAVVNQRVLMAVIDEGIAYAHRRFAARAGTAIQTRIRYLWQQDEAGTGGNELTGAQIDLAVNANASGAGEEGVYRALGGLEMNADGYKPLARRRSHGTSVLDLAAGYEPAVPKGKQRPIIVVDMPEAAVGDPAGSTLNAHAHWGLAYIVARAISMCQPDEVLPVMVNISYGPHEGPHDGSSMLERFMDYLVQVTPLLRIPMKIFLAAGNYRQSRTHAHIASLQASATTTLQWRLQPCTMTPSFMEIWLSPTAGASVQVTLIAPDGRQFAAPTFGPTISVLYAPAGTYSALRSVVFLFVAPTAVDPWIEPANPIVPSGLWTVTIKNTSQTPLDIDAWIRRSDTPGGRRAKGRQSYFDDPSYQRFDANGRPTEFDGGTSYVMRQGTLSGIATGQRTHVIGAFQRAATPCTWMPAAYSSEASAAMRAPNWLLPGDDSTACWGALGAGTRSGARVAMSGTSVAAPQAARNFADLGPPGVFVQVSNRVPVADQPWVAGAGLINVQPPLDRDWGNNRP
ncbi:hypothetical protein [Variovorax sp. dw_308]|uniref:hypothetical protein n=1 Tax=Variovorax sp. dw_308 TaxID=2721546 RepID=UPI001C44D19D|nr:hypothetical protein [Variovorax sp. dw_308]